MIALVFFSYECDNQLTMLLFTHYNQGTLILEKATIIDMILH